MPLIPAMNALLTLLNDKPAGRVSRQKVERDLKYYRRCLGKAEYDVILF